jgi:hypothetical protein
MSTGTVPTTLRTGATRPRLRWSTERRVYLGLAIAITAAVASLALIEAGVGRWPFGFMNSPAPVPGLGRIELCVDLFLVPMIVWDAVSRGRPHPVTMWDAAALIVNQLLRMKLAATGAWLAFAGWAVSLVS